MIYSEHDANFYALDKQVIMFFIMNFFSSFMAILLILALRSLLFLNRVVFSI